MPHIHITSFIAAPVELVFNLSRSINLHQISTASTNEKAIDGVLKGLINKEGQPCSHAGRIAAHQRTTRGTGSPA